MSSVSEFRSADRFNRSLLASAEKKALIWMAQRMPAWVSSDDLSALGFLSLLGVGFSYWHSRYYNTGLILQNLGRPEEAAQQYREALAVKPDLAEATQALAQISKAPANVEEIRKNVRKEANPGPRLLKSR